jgi:hypothetical protein
MSSNSDDQELLFPTSDAERRELQDKLVEAVADLGTAEEQAKAMRAQASEKIATARKRVATIGQLLRQSKPPRGHHSAG